MSDGAVDPLAHTTCPPSMSRQSGNPSSGRRIMLRKLLLFMLLVPVLTAGLMLPDPGASGTQTTRLPTSVDSQAFGTPLRRLAPVDAVFVIDDSGSDTWSDPANERYIAARFAARELASLSTQTLNHRIGVVHFGSTAPTEMSLGLTPVGDPAIDTALTAPAALLGDTNFAAALDRARTILGPPTAGRTQAVLVYTDGQADLGDGRSQDTLFSDISTVLQGLPRSHVHILGLDADGSFGRDLPRWQQLGLGSVEKVSGLTEAALERRYGAILANEIGLLTGGESLLAKPGDVATVQVGPYREALAVRGFSPDAASVIEVVDPSGRVSSRLGPGRLETGTVHLPQPGAWTIRLAAGSDAEVAVDQVPIQARLVAPGAVAPLGRDLVIEGTFTTSEGQPVADQQGYPRYFGAVVTPPTGDSQPVALLEEAPGHYRASKGLRASQAGTYAVKLVMKGGTDTVLDSFAQTITVHAGPYLAPRSTKVVSGRPVRFMVELEVAGHPVDAATVLSEDPAAAGIVRLEDSRGTVLDAERLAWKGGPLFEAGFAYRPRAGQRLMFSFELGTKDQSGSTVQDVLVLPMVARPTAAMVWSHRVRILALTVVAVLAGVVVLWCAWLFSHRPLHGRYRVGRTVVTLTGRPRAAVGTGWPWRPVTWVWGTRSGPVARFGRIPLPFGAHALSSAGASGPDLLRTPARRPV
jgi:hypothetical protein